MSSLTRDVAVVGVGYSPLSRAGSANPRRLTYTAVAEALADAGLRGNDVDGIFEYKFGPESPGAQDVARLIGAPNLTAFADIMPTNPSGLGGALAGAMAVASGVCETVVAFRCMTREAGYSGGIAEGPERISGPNQFLTPYGYVAGIIVNMALAKRRWMAEYGRTEEDFGRIAVNARKWSALNPRAVLREPILMSDYLESRMIVDPLRVFDCDYPINGAVASVITTVERARDLRQRPVLVDSMSFGTGAKVDWVFGENYLYGGAIACAERLWEKSAFGPDDVDVAELYDGFTTVTLQWIEALGFCDRRRIRGMGRRRYPHRSRWRLAIEHSGWTARRRPSPWDEFPLRSRAPTPRSM